MVPKFLKLMEAWNRIPSISWLSEINAVYDLSNKPSLLLLKRRSHPLHAVHDLHAMASSPLTTSIVFLLFFSSAASDTLTPNQSILDGGDTLVSAGRAFELGFFSPPGSIGRYVGIWYKNIPVQRVVWVANRNNPLINTTSGVLNLTGDGNLSLRSGAATFWSTNTSSLTDPTVQLLDSGNLVLSDGSHTTRWQSFDYPSDTLLPGMEVGQDPTINLDRRLTSWKSPSDPSPGKYSLGVSVHAAPDIYIWNGTSPEFRNGPWDGNSWGGSATLRSRDLIIPNFIPTRGGGAFYSYDVANTSDVTILVLDYTGVGRRLVWQDHQWSLYWYAPTTQCDRYGHCGSFGLCDSEAASICKCLPGFVSKSKGSFDPAKKSEGCVRRAALGCRAEGDGFVKVAAVKLPEMSTGATSDGSKSYEDCRYGCLDNCNCTAFAFLGGPSGCITWFGDLVDVQQWPEGIGQEFFVRVAASELASPKPGLTRNTRLIIIIIPSIGLVILGTLCLLLIRRHKKRGIRQDSHEQSRLTSSNDLAISLEENEEKGMKFLLFHSSTISSATNNFSEENKLGEGGFGPVYKGLLQEGQEIAVKRLATNSSQGLKEFKNEILLIAKLQHRNLVRLLGCCIQEEENMLIYEYMPNKSLDFYIFDSRRRVHLNWHMCFNIIEGITQGLLYLHKHSRLRIIHRDLKASNILLDLDMNPKISDFGIAKIFDSNGDQEKTRRVVGTYGYMAPEYVAEGLFSVKSDVFSFGVVLLEIITGKRNNYIYDKGHSQNLIGHAWSLWKEARWFELVDPLLDDSRKMSEIRRCIHVALMCVQESFVDRPTMSEVLTMLNSENASVPEPKQPAFFNLRVAIRDCSGEDVLESFSINDMSITTIESR